MKQEVMAISPDANNSNDSNDERFFDRGDKIDRAEWLMAQVDLDPIESHGSMEMSTTKFKSLGGKRFLNSERGNNEESQNSTKNASEEKPKSQAKKE